MLLLDKIVEDWVGLSLPRPAIALNGFKQLDGCFWCGKDLAEHRCCACNKRHIPWSRVIRLGTYEKPLSDCILGGKYAAWSEMLEYLGGMLGERIRGSVPPDSVLVPIPMPPMRRCFRGINHTTVIARQAAKTSNLKMRRVLWRGESATQASMTATGRQQMKRNAMRLLPLTRIRGKNIVLIDDVLTTGKTLEVATNKLRSADVLSVRVAVLAVTKMPKKGKKM